MKTNKFIPLFLLLTGLFLGCNLIGGPGNSGNEETWELRPFYGELRFQIVDSGTNLPIPGATLQPANISFNEIGQNERIAADEAGLIIVHQLERDTTYVGSGPPPLVFIFEAPGYTTRELSVDDLADLSKSDPYSTAGLPVTGFQNENGDSQELPLYEFTILLSGPSSPTTETAVLPTETSAPPVSTAEPTAEPTQPPTPTPLPTPTLAVSALTGPDYSFEQVSFSLDPVVVTVLYPSISEDGEEIVFLFKEDGYCVIDGCIQVTEVNLEKWWLEETIPDLETAIANQDTTYEFINVGAALLMQTNYSLISSPELQGIRAVTMHGQDLFIVHNGSIKYEYRGLTPDGRYYIQVLIPLSLPFLPDEGRPDQENQPHFAVPMPAPLPDSQEELVPLIYQYNDEVAAILENTADNTFTPNLTLLDQFVLSIVINAD